MRNKKLNYLFTIAIGIVIACLILTYKNIFQLTGKKDIVMALSDCFILPGIMILGLGALIFVCNDGFFDLMIYGLKSLRYSLARKVDRDPEFPRTFYDYKEKYSKIKTPYMYLIIIGGGFLFLSFVFNTLFYYV